MPNTRKKVIKTVYKDENSEEETGDFSDSGSDAHISDESGSDEDFQSDKSSETEFNTKSKKKKSKPKPAIVKPKFTKTLINKINKQNECYDSEPELFTVRDLTEEDKLLPSFLNLSESDSSDDETPKDSKKIIPTTILSIKDDVLESDVEMETDYKDVWSSNAHDNSEEIAKKTFIELEKHHTKIEETKATIKKYSSGMPEKESDVKDLLALGEEVPQHKPRNKNRKIKKNKDESDSDVEDWEEVNENKIVPQQGLELFVELPNTMCRKKKKIDVEMMMKRKINRAKKEQQVYLHKVHILCWIGHGNYVSSVLNDQDLMAAALSLVPSKECYPGERVDMKYLEQITSWYKNKLTLKHDRNEDKFKLKAPPLKELLLRQIKQKIVTTKKYLVFIFVTMLRALGLQCRIIFNFVTLPLKPTSSDLCSLSTKAQNKSKNQSKIDSDQIIDKKEKKRNLSVNKAISNKEKLPQVDGSSDVSPVRTRRTTRVNNRKSINTTNENEDVSPPKISKKSCDTVKDSVKQVKEKRVIAKSSRKLRNTISEDNKTVSCVNDDDDDLENKSVAKRPPSSPKLSLRRRKKDNTFNKSSENEVITLNTPDKSVSSRRSNRGKNTNANILCKELVPAKKINEGTIDSSHRKDDKLVPPQIIVTQPKASNENFNDKQSNEHKKVTLSRKRSSTIEKNNSDESQQKITKTRNKSAPGKDVDKSKYFIVTPKGKKGLKTSLVQSKKIEFEQKLNCVNFGTMRSTLKNDVTADLVDIIKTRIKEPKSGSTSRAIKAETHKEPDDDIDYLQVEKSKYGKYESDDDFKPTKLSPKPSVSRQKDKRVLSTDDETPKNKIDVWCEIFVEELEQWICVDITKGKIHDSSSVYNAATHPVCYVLGWDNNNYLKDLTRRYVPHWNTVTRKLRVEPEWFKKSIQLWFGPKTARDKEENEYLERMQLEAPLPKSISEYKNHPLYALKRHLLKFEALYPPDAATLGFVRGEAVYSRDCVYVCRSREIWLKEAKVVRLGEEPYKIVKARPKWDKLSNKLITDKPLEVFGPWQVQDYEPPVAENGIVPRNAYGNVELFKECMLPKGTVLIKLPGLNKVAKKLNIDCAPAMTGFDYTGGWAHPVFDGFVICKEYEEVITEAWLKDQEEQELRHQEKLETRIYGNWRKLIKGLLIRERIKSKYGFEDPKVSEITKTKTKEPRFVVKKKY